MYTCVDATWREITDIQKRPQFALLKALFLCHYKKHHGLFRTENKRLQEILLFVYIFSIVNWNLSSGRIVGFPALIYISQKLQVNTCCEIRRFAAV